MYFVVKKGTHNFFFVGQGIVTVVVVATFGKIFKVNKDQILTL